MRAVKGRGHENQSRALPQENAVRTGTHTNSSPKPNPRTRPRGGRSPGGASQGERRGGHGSGSGLRVTVSLKRPKILIMSNPMITAVL